MCLTWLNSWSLHFQWKRSTGMPQLVDDLRVDLAVAVVVRHHLAAARRSRRWRHSSGGNRLELLAVAAAAGILVDAAHEAVATARRGRPRPRCGSRAGSRASGCRATTACRRACRPAPSSLCGTWSTMRGDEAGHVGAGGVGEIAADHAARSCRARAGNCGERQLRRSRADSQALAASTTTRARTCSSAPVGLVHVGDAGGAARRVERSPRAPSRR